MNILLGGLRVVIVLQGLYLVGCLLAVVRLYWRNPPFRMHVIPTAISYVGISLLLLQRLYDYPHIYNPHWRIAAAFVLFGLGDVGIWLMLSHGEQRMRELRALAWRVAQLENGDNRGPSHS